MSSLSELYIQRNVALLALDYWQKKLFEVTPTARLGNKVFENYRERCDDACITLYKILCSITDEQVKEIQKGQMSWVGEQEEWPQ
jgi:hypothetical protein